VIIPEVVLIQLSSWG